MTVGEKIQFYRKRAGLSQEELGQQLLVSRQTVSLWETGQTMPTLDNLIRLRAIFGASIDEILCEECSDAERVSSEQDKALSYSCCEQKEDAAVRRTLYVQAILTALSLFVLAFGVISLLFAPVWPLICVVVGAAACLLCQSGLLLKGINRICAARGEGDAYSQEKCDTMSKDRHTARMMLLGTCVGGVLAFLVTAFLWMYGAPGVLNISALVLFGAAVPALICAVTGVFWRKLDGRWRLLNVLVGLILALVLVCVGIGTVITALPRPVYETQECLGKELPTCESISFTEGGRVSDTLFLYYCADFYLDADEASAFEGDLTKIGTPFVTAEQNALAYAPLADFGQGADAYLLFDAHTKEAFTRLSGEGYHTYFLFAYSPQEHLLSVAKCNLYVSE